MKRLICLLLCAVMLVFAAGCSPAPLTPKEYIDQFSAQTKNFIEASRGLTEDLINKKFDSPLFDAANDALDKLEKLSPPEDYKQLHQRLCDSIKIEREIVSLTKETFETAGRIYDESGGGEVSDEDRKKLENVSKRLSEISEDQTFSEVMAEIARKYKEENP